MRRILALYLLLTYLFNIINITNVRSFYEPDSFLVNNVLSWPYSFNPWASFSIDYKTTNNSWEDIKEVFWKMNFSNNSWFTYNWVDQRTRINSTAIINPIPSSAFNSTTWFSYEITDPSNLTIANWTLFDITRSSNNYNAFTISQNITTYENTLTAWIESKKVSDSSSIIWTTSNKTFYINVKPHITDYYFTKSDWTTTTSTIQWSNNENITLKVKVKDYNWCTNIDNWTVTANLSLLWLSTSETLVYDSWYRLKNSNI